MFDCDPVGIHEYVDNFFKELNKTISQIIRLSPFASRKDIPNDRSNPELGFYGKFNKSFCSTDAQPEEEIGELFLIIPQDEYKINKY